MIMEKLCKTAVLVLSVFTLSVYSLQIGIFIGLDDYKYTFNGNDFPQYYRYKLGFTSGILAEFYLSKYLSFEPEISYSMRGVYFCSNIYAPEIEKWVTSHYLTFPLHIKFNFPNVPFIVPYIKSGINFGFLVSAELETQSTYNNAIHTTFEDFTHAINSFDYGIDSEIGLELKASRFIPFIEADFYYGVPRPSDNSDLLYTGFELKSGIKYHF